MVVADPVALEAERLRRDFRRFAKAAWHIIEPNRPLVWGAALDAICDHLQAVTDGEIRNLVINIPPRCSKSSLVTILWPAWVWTRQPHLQTLSASYSMRLTLIHAAKRRMLIASDWYQARFGDRVQLDPDQNAKDYVRNLAGGHMMGTSVGGAGTGFGGDILIGDDVMSAKIAASDLERTAANDWFSEEFSVRANDPKTVRRVIVMQRLHQDDTTGMVLKQGGWCLLKLPMEYEGENEPNEIGWRDWRTDLGELLWPERFGPDEVADFKATLESSYAISGQLQQRPFPRDGGIFKSEWMQQRYDPENRPEMDIVCLSVDSAFKAGVSSDYSVIAAWGRNRTDYYLLDIARGRWEFFDLLRAIVDMDAKWNPQALLIEDTASGQSAAQVLRRGTGLPIVPVRVTASKVIRAEGVTGLFQAEKVKLPEKAPWLQDWLTEHLAFAPESRYPHDDMVDTSSMALAYLHKKRSVYGPVTLTSGGVPLLGDGKAA